MSLSKLERVLFLIATLGKIKLGLGEIAQLYDAVLSAASTGAVVDAKREGPAELAVQAILWAAQGRGPAPEWMRQAGVSYPGSGVNS